jgi:hypothetical protein
MVGQFPQSADTATVPNVPPDVWRSFWTEAARLRRLMLERRAAAESRTPPDEPDEPAPEAKQEAAQ